MKNIELLKNEKLIQQIKDEGCVSLPEFFSETEIQEIIKELSPSLGHASINVNLPHAVYANTQRFMSQIFVYSKSLVNFVCTDEFQTINQKLLIKNYHLKAARYYETGPNGISMWHHDEKSPSGQVGSGLIFIIYLSRVLTIDEGPFQYLSGSHKFSSDLKNSEDYFANNIDNNFGGKVKSIYGDIGTLLIADSKVIHRACPHTGGYMRSSIFMQVSELSKYKPYKEKILIDPGLINKNKLIEDNRLLNFFGFDIISEKHIFPITDATLIPLPSLIEIQLIIIKNIIKQVIKTSFEWLPVVLKNKIRRSIIKRPLDYNSIKK
jgi:ectoine hydroxylase-related dioxygenase (phytanoyl-CoA dioxygenase family)